MVKHCRVAAATCPSLKDRRVTVHVLRHTLGARFTASGVDRSVIALWLGHESIETTQIYLEAILAMKEQALAAEWHAWSLSTGRPAPRLCQRAVGHEYYAEWFADST